MYQNEQGQPTKGFGRRSYVFGEVNKTQIRWRVLPRQFLQASYYEQHVNHRALRQVSVPWGMKLFTNASHYNAQRDKSLSYCRPRARSVGRLGAVTLSNSTTRAQKLIAPSAISHDNDLGNELVQSRALASGDTARAVRLPRPLHACTCTLVFP